MPRLLPVTPTIEALKKQSKQILKAHKDGKGRLGKNKPI